jgi:hypothetical protein
MREPLAVLVVRSFVVTLLQTLLLLLLRDRLRRLLFLSLHKRL